MFRSISGLYRMDPSSTSSAVTTKMSPDVAKSPWVGVRWGEVKSCPVGHFASSPTNLPHTLNSVPLTFFISRRPLATSGLGAFALIVLSARNALHHPYLLLSLY